MPDIFCCDLGGEYISHHQTLSTNTLEKNGVANRKYKHIIEIACFTLLSAYVPILF